MFAFFNLGAPELIILGILGFLLFGAAVTIILVVTLLNRRRDTDESSEK
jgi:hypothetical protein